jgi:hypothetical protein
MKEKKEYAVQGICKTSYHEIHELKARSHSTAPGQIACKRTNFLVDPSPMHALDRKKHVRHDYHEGKTKSA